MKIFKKLLFLICIAPTSVMLGMEEELSPEESAGYQKFAIEKKINLDNVKIARLTWGGLVEDLDFGAEEGTEPQINSIYTDPRYLQHLANTKFVDFFKVYQQGRGQDRALKKLHIFFNFNKLESLLRNEIRAGFSDQINSLKASNIKLAEEKKQQQTEIAKLTEKNEKLTQKNEQQKLQITELAKHNKSQAAELGNLQTAETVRKSVNAANQNQNQLSWWQRIAPKLSVAAVMGGCMLLGAGLYSCFVTK